MESNINQEHYKDQKELYQHPENEQNQVQQSNLKSDQSNKIILEGKQENNFQNQQDQQFQSSNEIELQKQSLKNKQNAQNINIQSSQQSSEIPNSEQQKQDVQQQCDQKIQEVFLQQQFDQQIRQGIENEARLEEINQDSSEMKNESQVFSYNSPWLIYAMGFSTKPIMKYRIAIGSFLEEIENEVEIIYLNEESQKFERYMTFKHDFPPTKLMFIPDQIGTFSDLLATSADSLKIWKINPEKNIPEQKSNLINQTEFSAPLTSFDWNNENLNLIGTSSIDTTCTIWDIEKEIVYTQLIAHDKEVYDISFSPERNLFASVGADGSARQFDLRNLEHSTVLYETENSLPLLKLAWNRIDNHYIACIAMDENQITILDTRQPMTPVCKLINHKNCVNALSWAPQSSSHICTVADDSQALIWDLTDLKQEMTDPLLEYKADEEITNLSWSMASQEWLAICFSKTLQILKV